MSVEIPTLRPFLTEVGLYVYITPEGITAAHQAGGDPIAIARETLAIMASSAAVGIEDQKLCAYTAFTILDQAQPR